MVGIILIADDSGSSDATDFTIFNTGTEPLFGNEGDPPLDDFVTYNRQFVSDMPWYSRFIIWLFPRMHHLENYPISCEKSPNGSHQCDCPTGEPAPICQYCGKEMLW